MVIIIPHIRKYFRPEESGPLSAKVPTAVIRLGNKEVLTILSKEMEQDWERGQYACFTSVEKVTIACNKAFNRRFIPYTRPLLEVANRVS